MDELKKKKLKQKRKKRLIILLIIVAIIAFYIIKNATKKEEVELTTEPIQKRNIAQSIGATGTVTTDQSKSVISLLVNYKITDVKVKEGDHINVGDVICTFDTSSLRTTVANLNKSINVTNATTNIGINGAQRSLNDAVATKDDTKNALLDQIHEKKKKIALEAKIGELQRQQADLNTAIDAANKGADAAKTAQSAYEQAKTNYENLRKTAANAWVAEQASTNPGATYLTTDAPEDYIMAYAGVTDAKTQMENAQKATSSIPDASEIQATYDTVTQTINQLMEQRGALISQLNGVDSNRQTNSGIAALQDQVTTAQLQGSISTDSLRQQVTEYNKMLAETNLKSTVSGTITSLNVKKDDMYTGGVILTIDGMDEYIIETDIDEYDIPDVKEGMKVLIKTDATRDEELEGVVTYTAPASTAVSSASNAAYGAAYGGAAGASTGDAKYKVKIAVKTPNDRLRLGMNAKLSIIQSQKENVWTVPYESLLQRDDGSYYIEILKEGSETETEELNVQKGIEGTYYVEVISDALNENMNVVIPQVNDLNSLEAIIEAMGANGGM